MRKEHRWSNKSYQEIITQITMKTAIFCCLFAFYFCLVVSESVPCESIRDFTYWLSAGTHKSCYMNGTTIIDSSGVSISSAADASVGAFYFEKNKKLKFLPLYPAEKFANLVVYAAGQCAIERITKENFGALSKLKQLYLGSNKIETVSNDVFQDLIALELIYLDHNKIKFINSAAFRGLSKLDEVWLNGNVCIQGRYESATSIKSMIPTLTDKCGFSEDLFLYDFFRKTSDQVNKISESIESNRKEQKERANASNSLIFETKAEIKAEIVKSRDDNAKGFASIEVQLKTAKDQIRELQSEVQRHQQEKLINQKTITRQETELKLLREQTQKLNDEVKVNLETMKTQMKIGFNQLQTTTNQTTMFHNKCQQENKDNAVKCESELNAEKAKAKAATEQLEQKQMTNEKLQSTAINLQISKAQIEGKVKTLNQQMEHRTFELENVQAENVKNLIQIDQQATTIASLTTQTEILSNDFKNENDNFKECEREKAKIDVDLKISESKLQVFEGINITDIREKINSFYDLLRKGRGQVN